MKYRLSSQPLKILAFVLAAACLLFGNMGANLVFWNLNSNGILGSEVYQSTQRCRNAVFYWADRVATTVYSDRDYGNWEEFLNETNFRFILLDEETGDVIASYTEGLDLKVPDNLAGNRYLTEYNFEMELGDKGTLFENIYVVDEYFSYVTQQYYLENEERYWAEEQNLTITTDQEEPLNWQMLLLLPPELAAIEGDVIWEGYEVWRFFIQWFEEALIAVAVCVVLLLVCLLFLFCQAGHKPGQEEISLTWFDRVPLDLLLAVAVAAGVLFAACFIPVFDMGHNAWIFLQEMKLMLCALTVGASICGLFILGALVSFAARVKYGGWWRSMIIWRLCAWIGRLLGKFLRWIGRVFHVFADAFHAIGLVPKGVFCLLGIVLAEILLFIGIIESYFGEWFLGLFILFNLFLAAAAVFSMGQMRRLQDAAGKMAGGELEYRVDTTRMYWEFKRHGEYLNAIALGMNRAVEQRMKSERLKTELITNVSHDIKTPLTSIVNYVDLLQKPHSAEDETQYLEVLDRQAKRLKRLTENLVEASKASTGNLPVTLTPINVTEILNQAVEEYRERLKAGNLEPVLTIEEGLTVFADGRLLWRVLDNLLNNVIKYAMPGTRVYLIAKGFGETATIAVKNISREPLNVEADELMERFVRGDISRHTEGSGLGLNIAQSLTQLQNGQFYLTVDGDLFKAEVVLPAEKEARSKSVGDSESL